jgi:hypothetical protein
MANEEQVKLLKKSVAEWNKWRNENPDVKIDLCGADLHGAYLSGAYLSGADLSGADLIRADLSGAYLSGADLIRADLREADLGEADLLGADLSWADLYGTNLRDANLCGASLCEADLRGANLCRASLCGADLTRTTLCGAYLWFKVEEGDVRPDGATWVCALTEKQKAAAEGCGEKDDRIATLERELAEAREGESKAIHDFYELSKEHESGKKEMECQIKFNKEVCWSNDDLEDKNARLEKELAEVKRIHQGRCGELENDLITKERELAEAKGDLEDEESNASAVKYWRNASAVKYWRSRVRGWKELCERKERELAEARESLRSPCSIEGANLLEWHTRYRKLRAKAQAVVGTATIIHKMSDGSPTEYFMIPEWKLGELKAELAKAEEEKSDGE